MMTSSIVLDIRRDFGKHAYDGVGDVEVSQWARVPRRRAREAESWLLFPSDVTPKLTNWYEALTASHTVARHCAVKKKATVHAIERTLVTYQTASKASKPPKTEACYCTPPVGPGRSGEPMPIYDVGHDGNQQQVWQTYRMAPS